MNIFFLSRNELEAARYHNDRHCVKMIVEHSQLLSTALRMHGVEDERLYKITHKNHPSAIWTRSSVHHFLWLVGMNAYLTLEYTRRYGKVHKCADMLDVFLEHAKVLPDNGWIDPPQCMPESCKGSDTIDAYRKYYMTHKRHIATWKTQQPWWYS